MTRTTTLRLTPTRLLALALTAAATAVASGPVSDAEAASYCKGQVATIVGTANADRITGTAAKDVIYAGAGNDMIDARDGNDVVCGGDGDDRVMGGAGNDTLDGGFGNDACSTSTADTRTTCEPGMATTFMPTRHGFHFVNQFTTLPYATTPFGSIDIAYGLCGGMAFAARDTWAADDTAPTITTTPQSGVTFNYLWSRLLDSLTMDAFANLYEFNDLQHKTNAELTVNNLLETNAIKTALASGPVPVGVIIPSATGPIWANHQVLAIGWFTNSAGSTVIKLYDPNHPDVITYLDVNAKTLNGSPIRGLFLERFTTRVAPWS
jgi:hypothetical protein